MGEPDQVSRRHARPGWQGLGLLAWMLVAIEAGAVEPGLAAGVAAEDWLTGFLTRHGPWVGLLGVFVGGLALNLTPCVYPMIPVTLAFFSGQSAGGTKRTTALAAVYVLGLSLCYAGLGLLAAKTGSLLGSWLQEPAVLVGIAVALVALSLSMFGLYDIRPPQALMSRLGQARAGLLGAFGMGVVVGVIAAPCIGPFVLGLLLFVGQLANPVTGFVLFFVLGLGMGLPYLVLGVAANQMSRLPKAGPWLIWSKKALGVVLLGLALYFVRALIPPRALEWAVAALLLGSGISFGGWLPWGRTPGLVWARRLAGALLIVSAVAVLWPRPPAASDIRWEPYSEAAFEQARETGRPMFVDVTADWCLPCLEMKRFTFPHPDVVHAMRSVTTLRLDATLEPTDEEQAFLDRFDVFGVPTMMFFDRSGKERGELRLLGSVGPEEFIERLRQIM